ncbi:MAG: hypothetical protein EBX37_07730, partial [Alphaproteobacteria bacterium]|nr:hypothetical protein [Alphaproteobacteria bacterium]
MNDAADDETDDSPASPGVLRRLTNTVRRIVFAIVALYLVYTLLTQGSHGTPFGKQASDMKSFGETPKEKPTPQPEPEKPAAETPAAAIPEPVAEERTAEKAAPAATPAAPPAAPAPSPEAVHEAQRVAELERKLAEQDARLAGVTAQLEELMQSRGQMESFVNAQQRRLAALTLLGQLREALSRGEAFRP